MKKGKTICLDFRFLAPDFIYSSQGTNLTGSTPEPLK